jgi:nicotinamidase-related amidase
MTEIVIAPATTALVLIDLQRGIAAGSTQPYMPAQVIECATRIAKACRTAGVLVVLVRVEVGPAGVLFPVVTADVPRAPFSVPEGWADIVPELGPESGDVVVTKHQPNAFFGTDLDIQLSRRGIRTILLGGISTNIGVEATARAANERGYNQIFIEDAMAARETDLHEFPIRRYFPTIGHVRTTDEILAALAAATK